MSALQSKTVDEFCRDHRVSRTTVYQEVKRGRLRLAKIGRASRITSASEAEWLRAIDGGRS